MMNRIILIGVDQGVMIGGRFDGWLAQLTEAGWITIRKLDEADPYAALPGVIRSSQSQELGAVGPATGPRNDQPLHDAEARRRALLSRFPTVNAERLYENVLAQPSAEARALAAEAKCDALREASALYRDAIRIDVQMDGPKFMGANASALKRAWEADRGPRR